MIPGEIVVGLALLIGFATRLTAVIALFMDVNFFIMNGVVTPGPLFDAVLVVLEGVLIAFASYQALGIDGALARRGISSWWMSRPVRTGTTGTTAGHQV